jgi:hypothetical protein
MRPDNEVNVAAADKTVAFATGAHPSVATDPVFEATVVGMPPPAASAPGYDSLQKNDGGDAAFAKTDVFRKPGAGGTGES